jgi:ribosome maturation protein Sdo1
MKFKNPYKGFQINLTCFACPEQYDLLLGDYLVAYFRLRHGHFYVACPDVGGEIVYRSCTKGDGAFEDDEREIELSNGIEAVIQWMLDRGEIKFFLDEDQRQQYIWSNASVEARP